MDDEQMDDELLQTALVVLGWHVVRENLAWSWFKDNDLVKKY